MAHNIAKNAAKEIAKNLAMLADVSDSASVSKKELSNADRVSKMTDEQLLAEFSRLTGCKALACKHCHNDAVPLEKMSMGIRRAAMKELSPSMRIPKTCNGQLQRNAISNPIYNKYAALLKKATTEEEKEALRTKQKAEAAAARAK